MIGKAKRKKRTKTDKSKAPKERREGKVHREAEATVGKGVCPSQMTQEKTPNGGWEVSQRISMKPVGQTTCFESF